MPHTQNQLIADSQPDLSLHAYHGLGKFSWPAEFRHLMSRKFLNVICWPVFKYHQRWFTHSPVFSACKKQPGFNDLWKTIQKGAFAYNTLFLGITPLRKSTTDLADITTLALFWGDEFIDGIAEIAGKPFILQLIKDDPGIFYLQPKKEPGKITLHYSFDLSCMLPPDVLQQTNPGYGITYQKFYELLQHFLDLINKYLNELPVDKAEKAACKIADACNACLESFLQDVKNCPNHTSLQDVSAVLHYHESKTAYMQKKLLELRCTLAGKNEVMNSSQASGWLDIMRVIQVYDDIHDPVIDDGLQDNLLLSTAYHYFPGEWKWFYTNKHLIKQSKSRPVLLSLYMPCSMEYCFQLATNKIKAMNWEQQKIMHYLILKNKYDLYIERDDECLPRKEKFLLQFYQRVKSKMTHLHDEAVKSYVVNTCIHLRKKRKLLLRKINFSKAYQLRYNLFSLSENAKAAIFDSVASAG
jgi:hypothetical protein